MSERVAGATGTIHDQGYQRYRGERLPQSRRFLVIARNVMAVAWKSRWGVKLPVLGAGPRSSAPMPCCSTLTRCSRSGA